MHDGDNAAAEGRVGDTSGRDGSEAGGGRGQALHSAGHPPTSLSSHACAAPSASYLRANFASGITCPALTPDFARLTLEPSCPPVSTPFSPCQHHPAARPDSLRNHIPSPTSKWLQVSLPSFRPQHESPCARRNLDSSSTRSSRQASHPQT